MRERGRERERERENERPVKICEYEKTEQEIFCNQCEAYVMAVFYHAVRSSRQINPGPRRNVRYPPRVTCWITRVWIPLSRNQEMVG